MRLVFARDENEKFGVAKDELVDSFVAWAEAHDLDPDPFVVAVTLDYKFGVDGRLGRWNRDDVHGLLTEWFPRKVTMPEPNRGRVVPSLHAMVDFLAEAQLMESRSAGTTELHAAIEQHALEFLRMMADERNYDLGKFWASRMLQDGVDLGDSAAVDQFISAAQTGEMDVDQDVLSDIVQRQFFNPEPAPATRPELPPVLLPTAEELHAAAKASVLLARFHTLIGWLGAGRTLTGTGRLTVADGRQLAELLAVDQPYLAKARSSADLPAVSLTVSWAKEARLVRAVKGRLVPVKGSAPLFGEHKHVELWQRASEAVDKLGEHIGRHGYYDLPSAFQYAVPDTMPALWLGMYVAGGAPVPVELLTDMVKQAIEPFGHPAGIPDSDLQHLLLLRDVTDMLAALDVLGAVRLGESTDPAQHAKIAELSGRDDPNLLLAQLTPIGLWAVNRMLREQGLDAPGVGDMAGEDFEIVCARLAHAAPVVVEAELARWVQARDPELAAAEVVRFVERADEPSQRLFATHALSHAGDSGLEAAGRIRSAGGVAGGVAAVWLVEQDAADPSSLTPTEMLLGLVDHLAAMLEHGCLIDELASRSLPEQVDLVKQLARVDHPNRIEVLDAIADGHRDPTVAKAARKARLKFGSSRR
jgi:hypothetical protein